MAKTAKMNPEVKAKWINALTSGEYAQTVGGFLVDEVGGDFEYCALGVLADIRRKELKKGMSFFDSGNTLPLKVAKWAGFDSETFNDGDIIVDRTSRYSSIIEMNDEAQYSFKEITKIIDTNL